MPNLEGHEERLSFSCRLAGRNAFVSGVFRHNRMETELQSIPVEVPVDASVCHSTFTREQLDAAWRVTAIEFADKHERRKRGLREINIVSSSHMPGTVVMRGI